MRAKADPHAVGPGKCRLCSRYEHASTVCMPGRGPSAPRYVVVLGTPSRMDDTWCQVCDRPPTGQCSSQNHQHGQLLSDAAGYAFRAVLIRAKIDPTTVFYTSVVRCAGDPPSMIPTRRCRAYLLDELAALDLSTCHGIMLLGDDTVRGVLNRGHLSVKETRLRVLDPFAPPWGPPVRATFHPIELLLRDSAKMTQDEMVGDFVDLRKQRDPVIPGTLWQSSSHIIPDVSLLGIDLEWTQKNVIRCAAISDGTKNMIIPGESLIEFMCWLETRATKTGR